MFYSEGDPNRGGGRDTVVVVRKRSASGRNDVGIGGGRNNGETLRVLRDGEALRDFEADANRGDGSGRGRIVGEAPPRGLGVDANRGRGSGSGPGRALLRGDDGNVGGNEQARGSGRFRVGDAAAAAVATASPPPLCIIP